MAFGGAYGDELLPIISGVSAVTIVDPSDTFARDYIHGVTVSYIKPPPDGTLPFTEAIFDLITCFGVLHHIANVSFVITEIARCCKPGGYVLLREPIISMGDWRSPRRGLTKRERGISLPILESAVGKAGLVVARRGLCDFPLTPRIFKPVRSDPYNSIIATWMDALLSKAFAWNVNYHPRNVFRRLRPRCAFLVLRKPEDN